MRIEIRALHQPNEGRKIERIEQGHSRQTAERRLGGRAKRRIGMERKDDLHIVPPGQPGERGADRGERRSEAFPAMRGNEDEPSARAGLGQRGVHAPPQRLVRREPGEHHVERVDAAIAGDEDRALQPLGAQIVARRRGRREVEVGDQRDRPAVMLLGEGFAGPIGSETGLDMGDRDSAVKGGERGGEGGAGVALHDDPVGRGRGDDRIEPFEEPRQQRAEALAAASLSQGRNLDGFRKNRLRNQLIRGAVRYNRPVSQVVVRSLESKVPALT